MSPYQLVIFDCDGVLVDSERITNQVFADMLGELGLAFTLEDMFEQFVGRSMAQCLDKIRSDARPPATGVCEMNMARLGLGLDRARELGER